MKNNLLATLIVFAVVALTAFRTKPHGQIVCFGDSITYGATVSGHSWVWYLQQQDHSGIDFINAGRSGRKTSDKMELLPVLEKYPHADYYLIFLGVNDLKDGTPAMVDSCLANMQWMIDKIKESDPHTKIVLLAPASINIQTMSRINVAKKYNANTQRSLNELEKRYRALAKKERLGFMSLLHVVSPPDYNDGLHPNEAGQRQIADAVWKGLNRLR